MQFGMTLPVHAAVKVPTYLLVWLVLSAPLASAGRFGSHITPKLDPKSDKVFFKKDYPDDLDAKGRHGDVKFNFPYPAVQDRHDYDKDYVKDENADDGQWKAQMEYDLLRTKISKDRDDYKKAKETEKQLRQELEAAQQKEAEAAQRAKDAEKKVAAAQAAASDSKEKAGKLAEEARAANETAAKQHEAVAKEHETEVEAAVQTVKKEMEDLKNCQQELAEARARLKELVEKGEGNSTSGEQGGADASRQEEASKEAATAELELKEAQAEAAKKEAEDAELKREIADEGAKHDEAEHEYQKESEHLKEVEHDMDAAAHRLRKFRKDLDTDGGAQHEAPVKGRASVYSPRTALAAAAMGAVLSCWIQV
mmetsp:Transcript_53956/g.157486  ORF Transcript_53956/g.157486 Transcript_53956/m.157486 type:complete len:367 (+) Transcript_53956:66-1166(+)